MRWSSRSLWEDVNTVDVASLSTPTGRSLSGDRRTRGIDAKANQFAVIGSRHSTIPWQSVRAWSPRASAILFMLRKGFMTEPGELQILSPCAPPCLPCPSCRFANPVGFRFCGACGGRLVTCRDVQIPCRGPPANAASSPCCSATSSTPRARRQSGAGRAARRDPRGPGRLRQWSGGTGARSRATWATGSSCSSATRMPTRTTRNARSAPA